MAHNSRNPLKLMKTKEAPTKTCECAHCGSTIEEDESYGIQTSRHKWEEVCNSCELDLQQTCQITKEEIDPAEVSRFVVLKTEAAETMGFLPGIYRTLDNGFYTGCLLGSGWMNRRSLLWIAPLPKPDETYDISGHICRSAAVPFAKIWRKTYGAAGLKAAATLRHKEAPKYDKWDQRHPSTQNRQRRAEWFHARKTVLENPDILRNLECDQTDTDEEGNHIPYADNSHWKDVQEALALPDGLPTYHEWVFVEHKGTKVYYAGYKGADSWMTLDPEPKARSNGHGPNCFAISGLPNWGKHRDAYVEKSARRMLDTFRDMDKNDPKDLEHYKGYISPYDTERAIAKDVMIEALELGLLDPNNLPR